MNSLRQKKKPCWLTVFSLAPRVGIEPTAKGLTVPCSTAELPRNKAQMSCGSSLAIRDFCDKWRVKLTSRDQKLIH